ncbi:MAG: hypothetical protein JXR12_15195 [Neptunomonas phycophila]|uniref:hypothetical protein n=1 Tax=Neptunomonas phycophila TaxID=1572645 RepID=UPI003B8AB256
MAKVRSARGVAVNFDELKIKQQLVETPTPLEVKARQDFVDQRLKRRAKRQAQKVLEETQAPVVAEEEKVEEAPETVAAMDEFEESNENEELPEEVTTTARKQRKPSK